MPEPIPSPPLHLRPRVLAATIAFLLIATTGGVIDTAYYGIGPGPATDILSEVEITGVRTWPSKGKLLITTVGVSAGPLNVWEWLDVWIQPSRDSIHRSALIPKDVTEDQQSFLNGVEMERSKINAMTAAFLAVGLEVSRRPGALVLGVYDKGASHGKIRAHDRIIAIDGTPVDAFDEVPTIVQGLRVGQRVRVSLERDGRERTVEVVTRPSVDDPKVPALGIVVYAAYRLPHEVEIDTQRISGPSGGLVFALSIIDALTPEDLTGGRTIAVTGTIALATDGDGLVGAIGGIGEKVRAARAVGASAFILPADNAAEARKAGPGSMQIIPVRRLSEAVAALRRLSRNTKV